MRGEPLGARGRQVNVCPNHRPEKVLQGRAQLPHGAVERLGVEHPQGTPVVVEVPHHFYSIAGLVTNPIFHSELTLLLSRIIFLKKRSFTVTESAYVT